MNQLRQHFQKQATFQDAAHAWVFGNKPSVAPPRALTPAPPEVVANPISSTALAGGALTTGGVMAVDRGLQDIKFAGRTQDALDNAMRRFEKFTTMRTPSNSREATDAFHELTNIAEQVSRSSDDAMRRHPWLTRITSKVSGVGGLQPDLLRQGLVRSLLSGIAPEIDQAGKAGVIADPTLDVIGRTRAAGFLDYNKGRELMSKFPMLQNEAQRGLVMARNAAPAAKTFNDVISGLGRTKVRAGGLAAVGGIGALIHTLSSDKTKQASALEDTSAAATPVAAILAGLGLRDIVATPKDVLVSYGTDDRLGAGHQTPGKNIANIVNTDERFARRGVKAVSAPASQGLLSSSNPEALKKRYALGVDSGWGVMDDFYDKHWGQGQFRAGSSTYRDGVFKSPWIFGDRLAHGGDLLGNLGRVLKFHPDAPSLVSGNDTAKMVGGERTGVLGGLSRLFGTNSKYHHATYGDGSEYKGSGLDFVGKAHPAANISAAPAMDRAAYKNLVIQELVKENPGTDASYWDKTIGDRKIISVSGASRGDSVGSRVATLREAMAASGDDHFVLGMGGKNSAAQRAIAEAADVKGGAYGFMGFSPNFVDAAQNSDLHFMGMGGSTPYEMMASQGRAPIIRALDEEVFDRVMPGQQNIGAASQRVKDFLDGHRDGGGFDANPPDVNGSINPKVGLVGKQVELARKALASGKITDPAVLEALNDAANYGDGRHWMNPTRLVDEAGNVLAEAGSHKSLKRGLDGIVDYLDRFGIRGAKFGDPDDMQSILRNFREGKLSGLDDAARAVISGEVAASKAGLADSIFKHWKGARNNIRLRGAGKLGAGLAMASPMLYGLLGGKGTEKQASTVNSPRRLPERTGSDVANAALAGVGTAQFLNGANAIAASDVMDRLHTRSIGTNYWDVDQAAGLLDDYADASKKLMASRPLGLRNSSAARVLPISQIWALKDHPVSYLAALLDQAGMDKLSDKLVGNNPAAEGFKAREALRDGFAHYRDMASDPHAKLKEEFLHNSKWVNLPEDIVGKINASPTIGGAAKVMGAATDGWPVGDFAKKFMAPGRGPSMYGQINRTLGRAGMVGGMAAAGVGAYNLLRDRVL